MPIYYYNTFECANDGDIVFRPYVEMKKATEPDTAYTQAISTITKKIRYNLRIEDGYNTDKSFGPVTLQDRKNGDIKPTFYDNANYWTPYYTSNSAYAKKYYDLTVTIDGSNVIIYNPNLTSTEVTNVTASTGSLNIEFTDADGNVLNKFTDIEGDLDVNLCANGDYSDLAIPGIFNQLKNFIYNDTIFDIIRNNLSAFFPSIALEKRIVLGTILLTEQLVSGAITLVQYQELLDKKYEEYASQYGNDYVDNYVKLTIAIEKYKYLLDNEN